jgi:diacylglycerol kinase family enzyme
MATLKFWHVWLVWPACVCVCLGPATGHLLRTGQHVHVKGVNVLGKCRRLAIRAPWEQGGLAWECDGEPQGAFEAVEVEVLPGALRLLSSRPAAIVAPASAR